MNCLDDVGIEILESLNIEITQKYDPMAIVLINLCT